jgi:hypothetical protein
MPQASPARSSANVAVKPASSSSATSSSRSSAPSNVTHASADSRACRRPVTMPRSTLSGAPRSPRRHSAAPPTPPQPRCRHLLVWRPAVARRCRRGARRRGKERASTPAHSHAHSLIQCCTAPCCCATAPTDESLNVSAELRNVAAITNARRVSLCTANVSALSASVRAHRQPAGAYSSASAIGVGRLPLGADRVCASRASCRCGTSSLFAHAVLQRVPTCAQRQSAAHTRSARTLRCSPRTVAADAQTSRGRRSRATLTALVSCFCHARAPNSSTRCSTLSIEHERVGRAIHELRAPSRRSSPPRRPRQSSTTTRPWRRRDASARRASTWSTKMKAAVRQAAGGRRPSKQKISCSFVCTMPGRWRRSCTSVSSTLKLSLIGGRP